MLQSDYNNNRNGLSSKKLAHLSQEKGDEVVFKAKAGKIIGKAAGLAAGTAAGGAIIGGGSLAAGVALLSGPIGWAALGAAYFIGGAAAGAWLGGGIGDDIEDKINDNDDNNKKNK